MQENILLEKEQEDLLNTLVETSRKIPREKRTKFIVSRANDGTTLIIPLFPNLNFNLNMIDVEILAREGLIEISYSSNGTPNIYVLPFGFKYYELLKQKGMQPTENIENYIKNYLESNLFSDRFPNAYQKWIDAEKLLWNSDSSTQFTTIGHLCRESVQEFTSRIVEIYNPSDISPDKSLTVSRMRSVIDKQKGNLGSKERTFLDALMGYWGTVIDLIQREEHGGIKEGEPLEWEDGRRVVFQTAIIMFEIDRSLQNK
jgi:hypothetical protein